jgi:CHASE2 domain-containing sensor protein
MESSAPRPVLRGRGWVAGLLLLVGTNAVVAGSGFVGSPDGSAIGIPQEWLDGTPFRDYLVPGLVLAAMGVLSLASALLQLRRHPLAWAWAGVCGVGFVIWIAVQAALMGSFRHPAQTILQAAVLALGLVVAGLAWRQYGDWRATRPRAA